MEKNTHACSLTVLLKATAQCFFVVQDWVSCSLTVAFCVLQEKQSLERESERRLMAEKENSVKCK